MASRNFMPANLTNPQRTAQLQLKEIYEETRDLFHKSLESREPCVMSNGRGGTMTIKEVGWFKVPLGRAYFVTEKETNIKYDLATLDRLDFAKRD